MKKKRYITRAVKLVAFALAVVLTTYLLQSFVLRRIDQNSMRMEAFYMEEKGSLDAVLIGASDVYAGYCAPYAYEKYGYTSYPYATQSIPASAVLPQIKEVIKYQAPKMIVVEINAFLYKDNEIPSEANHRNFADNIPDDEIRRDFLNDAIPADKQIEYALPIIKYHSSWTDYPWKIKYLIADFELKQRGYSLFRGYKTVANEFHPPIATLNDKLADDDSTRPLGVCGERYLIETLEYLKANDIKNVVFMRFPHIVRKKAYTRFQRCNEAGRIIGSYGYDFINLERFGVQEGFDINSDFYNWDHLNIYGSQKLTDYIADLLLNEYGMTAGQLSEKRKASWDDSVNYYHMVYNFCEGDISKRLKKNQTGLGGTAVNEDTKSIDKIMTYAREHPDKGTYPVILD